jgi:hypothetical protein
MLWDYAAVARQDVLISQSAITGGSFDEMIGDLLKQVNSRDPVSAYRNGEHTYYLLHDDSDLNFIVDRESPKLQEATDFLYRLHRTFLTNPNFRFWKDVPPDGIQNEFSDQIRDLLNATVDRLDQQTDQTQQQSLVEPLEKDLLLRIVDSERETEVPYLLILEVWSKSRFS